MCYIYISQLLRKTSYKCNLKTITLSHKMYRNKFNKENPESVEGKL